MTRAKVQLCPDCGAPRIVAGYVHNPGGEECRRRQLDNRVAVLATLGSGGKPREPWRDVRQSLRDYAAAVAAAFARAEAALDNVLDDSAVEEIGCALLALGNMLVDEGPVQVDTVAIVEEKIRHGLAIESHGGRTLACPSDENCDSPVVKGQTYCCVHRRQQAFAAKRDAA